MADLPAPNPAARVASTLTVADIALAADVALAKADDAEQNVFGWANIATDPAGATVVDAHGHEIDPAALEAAAYEFVLNYGLTGDSHEGDVTGRLIESIYIDDAKAAAMGVAKADGLPRSGWWVGFHIDDRSTFDLVKSGDRPMFSIQGRAILEQIDDEAA